jgi:hypothetical protein
MNENYSLVPSQNDRIAVATDIFSNLLTAQGLPADNIIASTTERDIILNNLPSLIASLPMEEKREARYLSKFYAATAIGLFDAGLNYVWNEVVLNLRKKAILYGIDLFFDAAVGGKNRDDYKDEKDLPALKDKVLLDTCLKIELISNIVYKKVDTILTMRNEIAASHPNVESIGGYELLGWLQTCVKDVLQYSPSASAIQIRQLITNLKQETTIIQGTLLSHFKDALNTLGRGHIHNMLITLFGIFVDDNTHQILKKNIAILAPEVWIHADGNVKYNIGAKIDGYRTNIQTNKVNNGIEFLTIVNGLQFQSLPERTYAIGDLCDRLLATHMSYDNFHHEPPVAREILKYIKSSSDIPKEIIPKLTKTVLQCRLGRGLSYCEGVSPNGLPLYDRILGMLDEDGVVWCIIELFDPSIKEQIAKPICQIHLKMILCQLKSITVGEKLKEVLDYLLNDIPNAWQADRKQEFIRLTQPFISWGRK